MAILLTTMHAPCKPERAAEFVLCLEHNLARPYIEAVKVFLETKTPGDWDYLKDLKHEKLEIIEIHHRPYYSDMIKLANQWGEGKVGIIANADIYFDDESAIERADEIQPGDFWTISRYDEVLKDGERVGWKIFYIATAGAHDCWIFRTPLRPFKSDYHLGIQGCDLFMAQRAIEAGFQVLNPCHSILPRHRHRIAGVRNHKLDEKRKINYWNDPEYAPLGTQTYSPQPCSLEKPRYLTRRSPFFLGMKYVGRWLLPIYRAKPIKTKIDAVRKKLKRGGK